MTNGSTMLDFIGKCHVDYLLKGKVIGLSKVDRIIDMYARRLQIKGITDHPVRHCRTSHAFFCAVARATGAIFTSMQLMTTKKEIQGIKNLRSRPLSSHPIL